jgi:hypothetical protein
MFTEMRKQRVFTYADKADMASANAQLGSMAIVMGIKLDDILKKWNRR